MAMDPVKEFAAWLRNLHLKEGKPSYAEIVRRIQRTDPTAGVVGSTISEIFNGKRLPRWTTVEPIARALGGPPAVEECLRRWQQANARTTPTDTAPIPAPGPKAHDTVTKPTTDQPSTPRGTGGADPDEGGPGDDAPGPVPRRRPPWAWVVSTVTALGVAAAVWAAATLIDDRNRTPTEGPTAGAPTAPDTRPTGRTPATETDPPEAAASSSADPTGPPPSLPPPTVPPASAPPSTPAGTLPAPVRVRWQGTLTLDDGSNTGTPTTGWSLDPVPPRRAPMGDIGLSCHLSCEPGRYTGQTVVAFRGPGAPRRQDCVGLLNTNPGSRSADVPDGTTACFGTQAGRVGYFTPQAAGGGQIRLAATVWELPPA
ncbi:helix-turn-helix transcriptional regulator [Streptomyces sp. NPDC026589]|uniref:helix-turn-helix domain-containing protein n=1 Tax=Streptomyces sp. NPDC026589 TaxID=3155609 RepID=UPI0033EB1231